VGGVSGTVTVNLANLPASAVDKAVVVPVEAVFNPDNRQRNEPHVWVVKGEGEQLQLEDEKLASARSPLREWSLPKGSASASASWRQASANCMRNSRFESGRVNEVCNGYLSSVY
jgi:hypothetical protein